MKKLFVTFLFSLISFSAIGAPLATVNILNFGAKCDGVTNDTAAIQNALNAGYTVVVPPGPSGGVCVTNAELTIPAGRTISGGGTIQNTSSDIFLIDSASNIKVSGLHFIGGPAYIVFFVQDTTAPSSNLTITDNTVQDARLFNSFSALHGGGTPYYYIYYATAANRAKNISITGNVGYTSSPVTPHGTQDMFILVQFAEHVTISNNVMYGYNDGIQLWGGDWNKSGWSATYRNAGQATIDGNTVEAVYSGISVVSAYNVTSAGNTVQDTTAEALDAEASQTVSFTGNTLNNVTQAFNVFNDVTDITFDSNTVSMATVASNGAVAMNTQVTSAYADAGTVRVTNNTITAPGVQANMAQFPMGADVKNWIITGNTFRNVFWPGSDTANGLIFDANTLIYEAAFPASYPWAFATPGAVSATYTNPATVPHFSIRANKILNNTGTTLSGTGIQIQTCTVACVMDIEGNTIEAAQGITLADPGTTAAKTIFIRNNVLANSVYPFGSPVNTNTTDKVFVSGNVTPGGGDAVASPVGASPSGTVWNAGPINIPYVQGSTIMAYPPSAGGIPGWICTTAGVPNGGTGVFKGMAALAP